MIQAFETGKVQNATSIHLQLFPLFKALFITTNPIAVKMALKMKGWDVGSTRLPLQCDREDEVSHTLEKVLQDINPKNQDLD